MNNESSPCPKCNSPYPYQDSGLWICPECFHEWSFDDSSQVVNSPAKFLDIHGNELKDGDAVTTVKDLKLGKSTLKAGTKVKNIKLLDEAINGHDISCKITGHGSIYLKCSVVQKA